ncbi:MAG TPA: DUF4232 domain-containing protein [Polyangiaceae bacterium]|nr:DUF4232 domain-containing protein [Polyangiaceae bacterium]
MLISRLALSASVVVFALASGTGAIAAERTSKDARVIADVHACATADLNGNVVSDGAATGHDLFTVQLTNKSTQSCTLHGWANIVLLDASGNPIGTSLTQTGDPNSPIVTLAPGAIASFVANTDHIPDPQEEQTGCGQASFYNVTVPGQVTALKLALPGGPYDACQGGEVDEDPFQAGSGE